MNPSFTRFSLFIAIAMLLTCAVFHILTFIPQVKFESTSNIILSVMLPMFFTMLFGIINFKKLQNTNSTDIKPILKKIEINRRTKFLAIVVAAYVIFNFFFTGIVLLGDEYVEFSGGQYKVMRKGDFVRESNYSEFLTYSKLTIRLMTGHAILFYSISIGLLNSTKSSKG